MSRCFLFLLLCLLPLSAHAVETRGLRVVAKDPSSGQTGEVKLYNKSYAVIIGIDRYKNLSPDRQLKNAVKDARGIEGAIRKQYRFDRIFPPHPPFDKGGQMSEANRGDLRGVVVRGKKGLHVSNDHENRQLPFFLQQ